MTMTMKLSALTVQEQVSAATIYEKASVCSLPHAPMPAQNITTAVHLMGFL